MKAMLFQCKCMQFSGPSGKTVASLQEGQDCKRVKLILPPVPLTNAHTKNWSWSPSASTWAPAAAQMGSRKVISPSKCSLQRNSTYMKSAFRYADFAPSLMIQFNALKFDWSV